MLINILAWHVDIYEFVYKEHLPSKIHYYLKAPSFSLRLNYIASRRLCDIHDEDIGR